MAALFVCLPAVAQAACLPHKQATERLERLHGEQMIGLGLSKQGKAVGLFVSSNGSWTITVTLPNGLMCVVNSGQAWETRTPVEEGNKT